MCVCQKRSSGILLAFILGLVLRMGFMVGHPGDKYLRNRLYGADSHLYDEIAVNLIARGEYTARGQITARIMPGYPFFLAFVYTALGHNAVVVRIIQVLWYCLHVTLYP